MHLSDKQKKNLGIIAIAACLLLLFLDFLIINFIQDVFRYDLTGKNKFVWVILIILDVIVLSVLLKRTYDRYNLNNIIEELQNIAKYKQFDSQIEVNNLYDVKLSTLVNAINDLITATNESVMSNALNISALFPYPGNQTENGLHFFILIPIILDITVTNINNI